jgi:hypothetical protein
VSSGKRRRRLKVTWTAQAASPQVTLQRPQRGRLPSRVFRLPLQAGELAEHLQSPGQPLGGVGEALAVDVRPARAHGPEEQDRQPGLWVAVQVEQVCRVTWP